MFSKVFWIQKFQKIRRDQDGATAVEFAILAIPFFTILFAIIELAAIMFISSTLSHGLREASRRVLTGELQVACEGSAEFRALVCEGMGNSSCGSNLRFDVVKASGGKFAVDLLDDITLGVDPDTGEPIIPESTYAQTGANDVVIVRAQYIYPLAFPGAWTRLANAPGNKRILTATTAFRNEPFPGGCT